MTPQNDRLPKLLNLQAMDHQPFVIFINLAGKLF